MSRPPAKPVRCPACGQVAGVPIVIGFPSAEVIAWVEERRVALGGCLVTTDDEPPANRQCLECETSWHHPSRRATRPSGPPAPQVP